MKISSIVLFPAALVRRGDAASLSSPWVNASSDNREMDAACQPLPPGRQDSILRTRPIKAA